MDREERLESALIRLLVGIGEPCPRGWTCEPYEGLREDAIGEAIDALRGEG